MNFDIEWINISENIKSRTQPIVIFKRPGVGGRHVKEKMFTAASLGRVGDFIVPVSDLLQPQIEWSVTTSGDSVRVPVFAYTTTAKAKGSLLATGLELGFRAAMAVPIPPSRDLSGVKLFMHREVHVIDNVYRCYLGVAIRADKRRTAHSPQG